MSWDIKLRTFEALRFPKGSPDRNRLNHNPLTSEFARSCPILVLKDGRPAKAVENIEVAKDLMKNPDKYKQKCKRYTVDNFIAGKFWSNIRKNKYRC